MYVKTNEKAQFYFVDCFIFHSADRKVIALMSPLLKAAWIKLKPEAQKPKTFRVATFYAQKLSGRSA